MKVNEEDMQTIWFDEKSESVKIIDQTLLPFELKIKDLKTFNDSVNAIKNMLVRGAPLIGVTAAYGMYLASKENNSIDFLSKSGEILKKSRPTAVNLKWAVQKILNSISSIESNNVTETILDVANTIRKKDINACSKIGDNGLELLKNIYDKKKDKVNILTHCNAGWLAAVDWGTALAPVYKAHRVGIPVHVWVDETRPRNQGFNLTAWELMNEKIPCTLIVDNTGGHLMQKNMVDACITGTDRTTVRGDVCNKIGTYLKALAAKDNDIPFYVAAPISSIDFSIKDGLKDIPIEVRNQNEISYSTGLNKKGQIETFQTVPSESQCINYAFDVTPAQYITKIITEKKIVEPNEQSISSLIIK